MFDKYLSIVIPAQNEEKTLKSVVNNCIKFGNVILVDDVLYTGRTVQAALTAIQHYGRPNRVELMAMVDRRFNRHLPIKSDYKGLKVDALDEAYVKVLWEENGEEDSIFIYPTKPE